MFSMFQEKYRCLNHLMPMKGWLNDPNGLCYFKGHYHIFFQANPQYPLGGKKKWGHYVTKDFRSYHYHGICIDTDNPYDRDGVYSGSAIAKDDVLYLFYTGNLKEAGDYDYILEGRKSTVMRVSSLDGIHFSNKKVILKNQDYPDICTCHVRDPKIYEENGIYYMLLGARLIGDEGAILIYKSKDLDCFSLEKVLKGNDLGFMLECPDLFRFEQNYVFSFSPQGVKEEKESFRNLYSAGYCINSLSKKSYHEWDKGFDFYAPQTFIDSKKRNILIGWAGLDDEQLTISYEPTILEGWMHLLTCPRELTYENDKIYQYPIAEIFQLAEDFKTMTKCDYRSYMARLKGNDEKFEIVISNCFKISYNEGILNFEFLKNDYGRKKRFITIKKFTELLVFMDSSIVEVFINHGEYVFTSRIFSDEYGFELIKGDIECKISKMREFKYE